VLELYPFESMEDLGRNFLERRGLRVNLPLRLSVLWVAALDPAEPGWRFRNEDRLESLDWLLKPLLDHPTLDLLLGEEFARFVEGVVVEAGHDTRRVCEVNQVVNQVVVVQFRKQALRRSGFPLKGFLAFRDKIPALIVVDDVKLAYLVVDVRNQIPLPVYLGEDPDLADTLDPEESFQSPRYPGIGRRHWLFDRLKRLDILLDQGVPVLGRQGGSNKSYRHQDRACLRPHDGALSEKYLSRK
jgi:hypothetical protein